MARTRRGMISSPAAATQARKSPSRPAVIPSWAALRPPAESVVSAASRRMAIRSSTMRMESTSSRSLPPMRSSANALAMMVVLEIATTAPAKRLSRADHPKMRPARSPRMIWMLTSTAATIAAAAPTRSSFSMVNSRPMVNSSRMTPSSERPRMVSSSATSGNGTCGPTSRPARMYPSTTGWRRRWNTTVVTAATQSTIARLVRNTLPWCSMTRAQ